MMLIKPFLYCLLTQMNFGNLIHVLNSFQWVSTEFHCLNWIFKVKLYFLNTHVYLPVSCEIFSNIDFISETNLLLFEIHPCFFFKYNDIIVLILYILLFQTYFLIWFHYSHLFLIWNMWTVKFYHFKGYSTWSFSHWLSYCLTSSLNISSKSLTQPLFLTF